MNQLQIPNIKLGEVYDQRYMNSEVHYEALGKLQDFFGVNMPAHRHDGFFQIHFVTKGSIRVFLDDVKYGVITKQHKNDNTTIVFLELEND